MVPTDVLAKATGYERAADIEKCLIKAGVHFFPGKDGPWTTLQLINAAGGLGAASNGNDGMYQGNIL